MIILGLDPSLSSTGWGLIRADGNRLARIDNAIVDFFCPAREL